MLPILWQGEDVERNWERNKRWVYAGLAVSICLFTIASALLFLEGSEAYIPIDFTSSWNIGGWTAFILGCTLLWVVAWFALAGFSWGVEL